MRASSPAFLQIEPVGQCNLRCRMCSIPYRRDGPPHGPPAFLAFDAFRTLVDAAPAARELQLQGLGEPLLHPRFFDMVAYAAARGIRVSTNTNGTLLTARNAERCVTSGLDALHFSLDAASPALYERIRVRARFATVVRNLGRLMETRRRLASERPSVRLVMVLMRSNLSEIAPLVSLAHAHGVGAVFVQHLCHEYGESALPAQYLPMRDFVARESLAGEPDRGRIAERVAEARAVAARLGVDLRLPETAPAAPRRRCDWPSRGPYLAWDGSAMPCCMVSTPDRATLGNALREGLETVWNGEAYRDFRRRLASDDPPEICRSCALYEGTF